MITNRALVFVDVAVGVAIAFVLLPLSIWVTSLLSDRCVSSMQQLRVATLIWWVATIGTTLTVFTVLRLPMMRVLRRVGFALVFVVLVGVALPNLDVGSLDRTRQKRTMADIRTLANELESHRSANGAYPQLKSTTGLQSLSRTPHRLPTIDAWGSPYSLHSEKQGYTIISRGLCGQFDQAGAALGGEITDVQGDIVFRNGQFIRYPAGMVAK